MAQYYYTDKDVKIVDNERIFGVHHDVPSKGFIAYMLICMFKSTKIETGLLHK